jgi:glycolate oxidase iron-sulfur subunit
MLHAIKPKEHGPMGEAMARAVQTCVHCGFCLPACPTYQELGQEMDSPRGRIVLMKQVLEGSLPAAAAQPHLDRCLGCLACEPACPSGVPYRDLISPFRARQEATADRPWAARLRRHLAAATIPHPGRFRLALRGAGFARAWRRLVPSALRPMLDLAPVAVPPALPLAPVNPARGVRRARVGQEVERVEPGGAAHRPGDVDQRVERLRRPGVTLPPLLQPDRSAGGVSGARYLANHQPPQPD